MSQVIEVIVPDIGNFKDVPIIDLCVKPGDTVKAEDPLLTLESDKATIDIPSPADGVIIEFVVKVGERISEGSLVARIETAATSAVPEAPAAPVAVATPAASVSAAPVAGAYQGAADIECEMLVLGAGPGGYSAAFA